MALGLHGTITARSFEIHQDLEPGKAIDAEHGVWAGRAGAEAEITRSRRRAVRVAAVVDDPDSP
ncbi:hypothetical protein [Dactylosporangium sp. NPDC050588]|uniref:hypothetical protein n=1 Tax=Dactylosporangium sp. NPDC050588 TaxID=3157211 RepID=UPI0033CA24BF